MNIHTRSRSSGFSLVELLTVMAIIAILLSIASVGIQRMGQAQGVTSGLAIAEGIFSEAQRISKSRGTTSRVIIHTELDDETVENRRRYRRMMLVVYKEIDPETGEEEATWTLAGEPTLLPDQVYFSPELSQTQVDEGGSDLPFEEHRLSRADDDTAQCHYYEFNSQGICTVPGASFILEGGTRPRNEERPKLGKTRNIGGFVIWRNGGTSRITDITRIEDSSS